MTCNYMQHIGGTIIVKTNMNKKIVQLHMVRELGLIIRRTFVKMGSGSTSHQATFPIRSLPR
jgi:hypothetical protein